MIFRRTWNIITQHPLFVGDGMDGMAQRYLKIQVVFERREDGGMRVYSDDVPGFVLSGANCAAVFDDIVPALKFIFEHNRGLNVEFGPVVDLRGDLEEQGFLPPTGHVTREYVAPLQHAA